MIGVLRDSWALFLGVGLLMLGNGLQGTLLGVRGALEGFAPELMGYIMSAYFIGLVAGSLATPHMIRRVGHIRVFAALASLVSAAFIIYAAIVDPVAWFVMRVLVGFCFSGIYVVSESWINDASTNENRGTALSAYMIVQMAGIVAGQLLLNAGDPGGYELFVLISVLVSVSFAPILLSVSPAPVYEASKPMSLGELYKASPLGMIGAFFLGGVFGSMFGMGSVYGIEIGLQVFEVSILLAAIYGGGTLFQYPIGWLSDRLDRRFLIVILAMLAAASCVFAMMFGAYIVLTIGEFYVRVIYLAAVLLGGFGSPLYSLLAAHTNDFVEREQMASASSAIVFLNGIGAVIGPIATGVMMEPSRLGPNGWWLFMALMFVGIAVYGAYRATQRPTVSSEETGPYAAMAPRVSPIAAEMIQEAAYDAYEAEAAKQENISAILAFWFDAVGEKGWWTADSTLDAEIRETFGDLHAAAARGEHDDWADTAEGALALIILLDQFSRNLYRNDPRAFENDAKAREIAEAAIASGYDMAVEPERRVLFYMPFEHSETLADQELCVEYIKERTPDRADWLHHAEQHRDLIKRFGRFPHRNDCLGRENTADERAHLDGGGYQPGKSAPGKSAPGESEPGGSEPVDAPERRGGVDGDVPDKTPPKD